MRATAAYDQGSPQSAWQFAPLFFFFFPQSSVPFFAVAHPWLQSQASRKKKERMIYQVVPSGFFSCVRVGERKVRKRDEGWCQRLRLGAEAGLLGVTDSGVMWALSRN